MNRKYRVYTYMVATFILLFTSFEYKVFSSSDHHMPSTVPHSTAYSRKWTKTVKSTTVLSNFGSIEVKEELLYPDAALYVIKEESKTPCHLYTACEKSKDTKYFYESNFDEGHADARFYNRNLTDEEHIFYLKNLIKNWSEFTTLNEIVSWVSHGALLSWYWNEKLFPWDKDLDFQMTFYDLVHLSENFNQTMVNSRYLLDINPNLFYRAHQLQNVIDARFIDTVSGLYIDLTALSSNSPYIHHPVICCKSPHCYTHGQLFPLHVITLEGQLLYRPNNVLSALNQEYAEVAFYRTDFYDHNFNRNLKKWIPKKKKPSLTGNLSKKASKKMNFFEGNNNGKGLELKVAGVVSKDSIVENLVKNAEVVRTVSEESKLGQKTKEF